MNKIILILSLISIATSQKNIKSTEFVLNRELGNFKNAISISGNSFGEIFVLDSDMLYKFSSDGILIDSVGGIGWSELNFNGAKDVSATFPLSIFVTEANNKRIQKIDKNFSSSILINYETLKFENEGEYFPIASATTNQGEIVILEKNKPSIIKINSSLNVIKEIVGENIYSQILINPKDIVVLENNFIVALDEKNILIFEPTGNLITRFLAPNQATTISSFNKNIFVTTQNEIILYSTEGEKEYFIKKENIVGLKNNYYFKDIFTINGNFYILTPNKILIVEPVFLIKK